MTRPAKILAPIAALAACASVTIAAEEVPSGEPDRVSYYEDIRPIFQGRCHGCHQPAKAKGDYVMTSFPSLLKGGETEGAVIPGDPDASYLVDQITPDADGAAEMPQKEDPLAANEIELVRQWIAEGAVDDTPENARERFDADNPPVYTVPPVVTSLDFSPDGRLIAVSGFHEVVLNRADGSGIERRLIGLAERIESVRFSPDGTKLAVTGGLPARMGEVQIWDVESGTLDRSVAVTFDTIYGATWSPDGTQIAFGCADSSVRAIDAAAGEEVLYQAAHNDWVFDTVFSVDGSHLVSVGRDQTAKLTEVATQRFVDNITSITPGALRGGIHAVARHPERDEVLVGGADGTPQIFRLHRLAKRVIGDNSNLVRTLPAMSGRIFSVDFAPDGKRAVAGSSLDGRGEVSIYTTDYDSTVSDELKGIFGKQPGQRSEEERRLVDEYVHAGVALERTIPFDETSIYAVAFSSDGATVAAAGSDGSVRLISVADGSVTNSFMPVPIGQPAAAALSHNSGAATGGPDAAPAIADLDVQPAEVKLAHRFDSAQLVVTAIGHDGIRTDVTRAVEIELNSPAAEVSDTGRVSALADGDASLRIRFGGVEKEIPVHVSGVSAAFRPDYVRDVNPVITKLGCNAGTCHGSKDGKNGFKLSLRGYDAVFDIRSFTDDLAGRRVNLAVPENSLMLLKSTGAVPHEGGQVTKVGDDYYEILRAWIAAGGKVDLDAPRVTGIEVHPRNPVAQRIDDTQQLRVVATFADGARRDVTREAFIETGNGDVAEVLDGALVKALRRGEAPLMARYEGAYAATTLTVMGDRSGFEWVEPPVFNEIDRFTSAKWKRTKTLPSDLCTDAEFVRRVHLDLTGLPPTPERVESFLADARPAQEKRNALIDELIGSEAFIEYWTNKWADLLQVNGKFLGGEGAAAFRAWIREQVAANAPYDEFVRRIVTASGSNRENPPASYYKILRTPEDTMENTTHLFLATRFNCNKCHDHPFERWTQDQYYEMAAYFARVGLKRDPESGDRSVGGTAVEGAKPLYEIIFEREDGEVTHERTGQVTAPEFPFPAEHDAAPEAARREKLAAWITSPDNPYFAMSYVNRLWGYLFGTGIIEPIDDIRAGNPPSNPELLDWLTDEFIEHGFDARHVMRTICQSRTYQLSVESNPWNEDDTVNFSHAKARRLPAEVLYDSIYAVTGAKSRIPGVPEGTRAAELPDAGVTLADGFLGNLGRPARESSCECERSNDIQLGPIMALVSGPTVGDAISDPKNAIATLVNEISDDRALVDRLFLRILNRPAREPEIDAAIHTIEQIEADHAALTAELDAYEAELAPITAQREQDRLDKIAAAEAALAVYEEEIAPREAELDRQQQDQVARLQEDLAAYEAGLSEPLAQWEAAQQDASGWTALELADLASTNGATLAQEPDKAVIVSGSHGKTTCTFTARTDVAGITGVRLEALTDDRLPNRGPGRADGNGNFVLSELQVTAAPANAPDQTAAIAFARAEADFSQDGYAVATAIDGQSPDAGNGWAIAPDTGKDHIAVFEMGEPVAHDGGTVLSFSLVQNYTDGKHALGKFRISVTNDPRPVGFGLPEEIKAIISAAPESRSPEQKDALLAFFRDRDQGWKERKAKLDETAKPRPTDPKLVEFRAALDRARQPLPIDPKLARLRRDAELSASQLESRRLTAAQDIAWALINTPAFLFNR